MTNHEIYIKLIKIRLSMDNFFEFEDWSEYAKMESELDKLLLELNPEVENSDNRTSKISI